MNKFNVLDNGLIVNKISKSFGNKPIVRDLSLNIKKGEIVGLLGPNGAGKTTYDSWISKTRYGFNHS